MSSAPLQPAAGVERPPSIYRHPVLWLLMLVSTLNFLDRQVLNILAEPIKRELGLSDTQIGLMTGLAFSLFYTLLGIPIARYADRPQTNRVRVIAVSLAIWSAMTAFCGMAQSFSQLLLARVGLGAGEAGCTPAAHSLISDVFSARQRPVAIAFFGLGLPLGLLFGLGLGGVLAEKIGWRLTLLVLSVPGLIVSALVWLLVRDPRRPGSASGQPGRTAQSLGGVIRELGQSRGFTNLLIGMVLASFLAYGKGPWQAIFLIRSHGLGTGIAGLALGVSTGIGSGIGTWLGGALARRMGHTDRRHILTATIVGLLLSMPLSIGAYSVASPWLATLLLLLSSIMGGLLYGPVFTCVQGLVRPASRAAATALFLFVQNLVGLGLGPLFFGIASDALIPTAGAESVRWVLILATFITPIPMWFFWRSSLRLDVEMRY